MKTEPEKTCPFCNRKPKINYRTDEEKFVTFISCGCGGYTAKAHIPGFGSTPEKALSNAIEKWDTRSNKVSDYDTLKVNLVCEFIKIDFIKNEEIVLSIAEKPNNNEIKIAGITGDINLILTNN
jgi:ATP:corrinoid adenosyltransferase